MLPSVVSARVTVGEVDRSLFEDREPGDAREAEIQQLGAAARQHDVAGLEIPVHQPLAVRSVERVRDLDADLEQLGRRQRPALEPGGERLALDQLHHQEVRAVRPGLAG